MMNSPRQRFDITLACNLVRKTVDQVMEQLEAFDPQLLTANALPQADLDIDPELFFEAFDTHVGFRCQFNLQDYKAFSYVGINFVDNTAVECVISLGRPANPERFGSESEVTKAFLVSLEELYLNGRIHEESEPGTKVYTWKKDGRTAVSFVSSPSSSTSKDAGALLSIQVRDTELHPMGDYCEALYDQARKSVEDVRHVILHRHDESQDKVYEGRSAQYRINHLLSLLAIGLGIGGIVSVALGRSVLGMVLIISAVLCAFAPSELHAKVLKDFHRRRRRATDSSIPPSKMEMSGDLYKVCWDWVHDLAVNFNETLSMGVEYESCFDTVLERLSVPAAERLEIFERTLAAVSLTTGHTPYHKLSPLNQFLVTVPGYMFYCLESRLPAGTDLSKEAAMLMERPDLARYLQEEIGIPVSQDVKGALWRPDILKRFRKRRP